MSEAKLYLFLIHYRKLNQIWITKLIANPLLSINNYFISIHLFIEKEGIVMILDRCIASDQLEFL